MQVLVNVIVVVPCGKKREPRRENPNVEGKEGERRGGGGEDPEFA